MGNRPRTCGGVTVTTTHPPFSTSLNSFQQASFTVCKDQTTQAYSNSKLCSLYIFYIWPQSHISRQTFLPFVCGQGEKYLTHTQKVGSTMPDCINLASESHPSFWHITAHWWNGLPDDIVTAAFFHGAFTLCNL